MLYKKSDNSSGCYNIGVGRTTPCIASQNSKLMGFMEQKVQVKVAGNKMKADIGKVLTQNPMLVNLNTNERSRPSSATDKPQDKLDNSLKLNV